MNLTDAIEHYLLALLVDAAMRKEGALFPFGYTTPGLLRHRRQIQGYLKTGCP